MSATLHHTEVSDERAAFEQFMSHSRRNKDVKKAAELLNKFEDGTYINEHVQRHWWTWQQATLAFNRPQPKTALSYFADDVEAAKAQESGETAPSDAKDAARWRRLVNASELPFPVAAIADDPENDRLMVYGRKRMEQFIDSLDLVSDKFPPAPNQGEAS